MNLESDKTRVLKAKELLLICLNGLEVASLIWRDSCHSALQKKSIS